MMANMKGLLSLSRLMSPGDSYEQCASPNMDVSLNMR
jgi:hypothetical protein